MCPNDPTRDEVLAEMTTEKLEEMARPTPRASSGSGLRDFLEIPYDQLEEMNLQAKEERLARKPADVVRVTELDRLRDVGVRPRHEVGPHQKQPHPQQEDHGSKAAPQGEA